MPKHPLTEVFGFPPDNFSPEADRYRRSRLCPFNNKVPNCTKDKANDPLGVCSIFDSNNILTITCPIRFRENWLIAEDAANFFFPKDALWTTITEARLNDAHGKSAGNIDMALVSYEKNGKLTDFGALEIQAVYISGNIRSAFQHYMADPRNHHAMDWTHKPNYPRPDYLSSSRKRLAPQLIYKGGILQAWKKKLAVAVHSSFYNTLPTLPEVRPEEADVIWMIYDLLLDGTKNRYCLSHTRTVFTSFQRALQRITTPEPGPVNEFVNLLQDKLNSKLEDGLSPPIAPTLTDLLESDEN